jgi:AraC family transcriptional regulator
MPRPATARSYAARIARVVAALHAEPDRDWRLGELAAIACFSPYHFHRLYRAICGETPDETRRRLRLHRAAGELIGSAREIEPIARRAGYRSATAFSRAFSAAYGRPPASYRQRQEETMTATYDVTIGADAPRRLVGLPHQGAYQKIGQAFERLGALAYGAGLDFSRPMIGVYYDYPSSVPEAQLRSFAALEAAPEAPAPAGLESCDLAGGPSASIVHKGPYAELPQAWDWLYCQWLPQSGREPADAPPFEVYLNDPRDTPPAELLTRIVVPLKA